ncbi:MAG: hypothetical protein ACP5I3_11630 [Thermoproteus sp.]
MMFKKGKTEIFKRDKAEAFFKKAISIDVERLKEVQPKVGVLDSGVKKKAAELARRLKLPPGDVYRALMHCISDPSCDVDLFFGALEKLNVDERKKALLAYLAQFNDV